MKDDPSCISCKKYFQCEKPKKGPGYVCNSYKERIIDISGLSRFSSIIENSTQEISHSGHVKGADLAAKDEMDLAAYVKEVLSTPTGIPRDMKVDDRDLKDYPNFYRFCVSAKGLNIKPFARQALLGIFLFSEWCPVCSNPKFTKSGGSIRPRITEVPVDMRVEDVLDDIQLLKHGVCPKCKATKRSLFKKKLLNPYVELSACVGQRAGKSTSVSLYCTYIIHKYLKLQRPTEVFGLLPNTTLTATFVGLTFDRAVKLLWSPIHDAIRASAWFVSYHAMLKHYSEKYGEELYKDMDTFIHYRHRQMFLAPSGPNKRTLRGDTRFLAGTDELGWFPTKNVEDAVKMNADEIYTSLDRSLLTIRTAAKNLIMGGQNNILPAFNFNISSPSSEYDKIMSLVKNNRRSREMLTLHLPTWKFNPNLKRADFDKEFREDPIKAERDYGANPPAATNPFFANRAMVQDIFHKDYRNRVHYHYVDKKDRDQFTSRSVIIDQINPPALLYPSILTIDAGYNNNSFALGVSHREKMLNGEYRMVTDALVEISPERERIPVNYTEIFEQCVIPLIKGFNVKVFAADRFQSIMMANQIAKKFPDISVGEYSMTYEDFVYFRSTLGTSQIVVPGVEFKMKDLDKMNMNDYPNNFRYKPVSHLYLQVKTVNDGGNSVLKGDGFTDDLFRVVAMAHCYLMDEEFCNEYLNSEPAQNANKGIGSLMGRSGGINTQGSYSAKNEAGSGIVSISNGGNVNMGISNGIFIPQKK